VTNAIPPAVWLVALPHTGLDPPFSSRVFCRWIIGWIIVRGQVSGWRLRAWWGLAGYL